MAPSSPQPGAHLNSTLFDLTGKVALVSGCSRGIGLAMAEALASAGADIIGLSSTIASSGSQTEHAVAAYGRRFTALQVDYADRDSVAAVGAEVAQEWDVDILVNNAGIIRRSPAAHHPDDDWDRVMEVNLRSHFVLTRHLATGMLERGSGKIIFTASMASFQGNLEMPSYSASKSGVLGLTRALANEWAVTGVNVNAIAPGYLKTDMTQFSHADPDRRAQILARIPAGRWGRPSDIAGATIFLASSASDYVHGIVLPVDGGWLVR